MKHLIIIGARGFGREVYNLAINTRTYGVDYDIKGFLDDKSDALDGYRSYPRVISSAEDYLPQKDDVFVCALGDVNFKKKYVDIMSGKGGEFVTLVHRNVSIGQNTSIGKGCLICDGAIVSCDAKIGNFVTLNFHTFVAHDAVIGDFCQFNPYSSIAGFVNLGSFVTLNTGAIVIPKVVVEDHSVIGAGAVVLGKVKTGTTVFGNPARKISF